VSWLTPAALAEAVFHRVMTELTTEATVRGSDPPATAAEVRRALGLDGGGKRRRRWIALAVAVLVLGIGAWRLARGGAPTTRYQTAAAERGKLAVTVTATGRLEARETVDVGSEVSGRILTVHADFNDRVKKGDVLAEIDTERLGARVEEADAEVAVTSASVSRARVAAEHAASEHERAERMFKSGLSSRQQLDAAAAEHAAAEADLRSAQAKAAVAGAGRKAARTDVGRARIVAPIDGVVLARNVERGQTLASSFQVPVLFKLCEDLERMELEVAIDEADVGKVKAGQRATFTVEAFPGKQFDSKVLSVRNVATIEQGVVTYAAVLEVDNHELLLRPGMTATADIVTDEIEGVLLVPNAALRFLPPDEAKKLRDGDDEERKRARREGPRHRVWTLRDGKPVAVAVKIGRSDGTRTEVTDGELEAGTELCTDVEDEAK
jgi:HlyD family secretion protein